MSNLIIINDDNTVSVVLLTDETDIEIEAEKIGAIIYEAEIPKSDFLVWNSKLKKVEMDTKKELCSLKVEKLSDMSITYQTESTKDVPYKDVLYKGGDASASAIAGAVELAQSLQEIEVKIIGSDDNLNVMSFSEALELSGLIAKAWRTVFFRYKELKVQISNATTVQELDGINW